MLTSEVLENVEVCTYEAVISETVQAIRVRTLTENRIWRIEWYHLRASNGYRKSSHKIAFGTRRICVRPLACRAISASAELLVRQCKSMTNQRKRRTNGQNIEVESLALALMNYSPAYLLLLYKMR